MLKKQIAPIEFDAGSVIFGHLGIWAFGHLGFPSFFNSGSNNQVATG
jgi:hypothetical protein